MKWALVIDGIVHEVTDIDPAGRFALDLVWVECDDLVVPGWTYSNLDGFKPPTVEFQPLDEVKVKLKASIDMAAETERLKYITAGAGQAMEYQQSAAEAKACLATIAAEPEYAPGAAEYPMLAASIGIDGVTIAEVATTVNAMHEAWLAVGSAIRAARLGTKLAIDAAGTVEDAQAAFDAVVWPAP